MLYKAIIFKCLLLSFLCIKSVIDFVACIGFMFKYKLVKSRDIIIGSLLKVIFFVNCIRFCESLIWLSVSAIMGLNKESNSLAILLFGWFLQLIIIISDF
jgi:hypothetical protein